MVTWSVGAATREASSPCLIISGTNFWSLSIKTFVWTSKPLVLKSVLKIIKKEVEVYTSNRNEWSKIFRNHPWVSNSIIHFFRHKIYVMLGDRCYLHLVINKSYFKNEKKTMKIKPPPNRLLLHWCQFLEVPGKTNPNLTRRGTSLS